MGKAKIAITVDERALQEIDRLVQEGVFPNRSQAIEEAVQERIAKLHRSRLAEECAKLDVREEQALAEEGYVGDSEWPEY
jgi:Arc/MetJ-type ribon-helix-helix transcriptional regulator